MKKQANGNGDGKGPAEIEEFGEAIPWMPEGWWSPAQCIDRTGRQITVWRCAVLAGGEEVRGERIPWIYVGHGTRAEKVEEGMLVQPLEFVIEAASLPEAIQKYDACLAEVGERVGEEMRREYTRQRLMVPPGLGAEGQDHSGTFRRMNQKPRGF